MKKSGLVFLIILQLLHTNLFTQKRFLSTPIAGNYMQDYYIVNYVDWSTDSILDHHCGSKTYDGHQGTDFVLRNFKQMDQGVSVFAAADGIVTSIVDSLFDRNKEAISGHLGNYIAIRHSNKYYSYYGHLKKKSLRVKPGDIVVAGQAIAEVGSSGYSSDPHLHFELWYDSLYLMDPFSGPCGNDSTLWISPKTYIDSFGIIDHDFCNFFATLDELKERIPSQKKYTVADDTVNFWMEGFGIRKGDISKVNWYTPQNNLWFTYSYMHPSDLWYYHFNTYIFRPAVSMSGFWKAEYLVNNQIKFSDFFEINEPTNTIHADDGLRFYLNNYGEIHFDKPLQTTSLFKLYNVFGAELYSEQISSGKQLIFIPISDLMNGIYILTISNPASSFSYKFIKN